MADPTWTVRPWQPGNSLGARTVLLLDTAEPATALRQRDARAGSADVARVPWQGKADRSMVMVKPLADPAPADIDATTLFWRASGEDLLDADAIIRAQVLNPEGWTLRVVDVTSMADGRVHSLVEVLHGGTCFLAHTLWRFRGALVVQADETWATWEAPPAWRTAEAIGTDRRDGDDRHAGNAPAARP